VCGPPLGVVRSSADELLRETIAKAAVATACRWPRDLAAMRSRSPRGRQTPPEPVPAPVPRSGPGNERSRFLRVLNSGGLWVTVRVVADDHALVGIGSSAQGWRSAAESSVLSKVATPPEARTSTLLIRHDASAHARGVERSPRRVLSPRASGDRLQRSGRQRNARSLRGARVAEPPLEPRSGAAQMLEDHALSRARRGRQGGRLACVPCAYVYTRVRSGARPVLPTAPKLQRTDCDVGGRKGLQAARSSLSRHPQRCGKLLARRVAGDEGAVQAGVTISFIGMFGEPPREVGPALSEARRAGRGLLESLCGLSHEGRRGRHRQLVSPALDPRPVQHLDVEPRRPRVAGSRRPKALQDSPEAPPRAGRGRRRAA